jgi:predicted cupin superfamily sugar epimerase
MSITNQLIQKYNLEPHPEGGWYKQTYKSNEQIAADALPERFRTSRAFSTAIYFLLEQGNFSAFHRIKSDECWHFYAGDPLLIYIIEQTGELKIISLGK